MVKHSGFWDFKERLLETLIKAVDFKRFRPILDAVAGHPSSGVV